MVGQLIRDNKMITVGILLFIGSMFFAVFVDEDTNAVPTLCCLLVAALLIAGGTIDRVSERSSSIHFGTYPPPAR